LQGRCPGRQQSAMGEEYASYTKLLPVTLSNQKREFCNSL
jgi:hypothetical protein